MSLQSFAEGSPGLRRDLLKVILLCCTVEKVFSSTVLWPLGQYGLPMPKSNCPTAQGFVWKRGNIYQDLEDNSNQTRISPQSHLQAIILQSTNVMRNFCIKTDMSTSLDTTRKKWPKGQYCIYQKGSSCPAGMSNGSLLWDDENGVDGNKNSWSGTLPKGVYNHDTKIFFCCQRSGSYNVPIELPTDKPFYLLAFRPHCQEVLNTGHIMEFIEYATEIHNNHDKKSFPYPYGADFRNPRIHYCYYYYKACLQTMTASKGTFSSPYYPQHYNNKASCNWYINAPRNFTIMLTFEDFALQTGCCKCDYVEVWETFRNGTRVLIETFCGDRKPDSSQPIKSRSNNVMLIFYSDANVTSTGFNASYKFTSKHVDKPTTSRLFTTAETNATRTTIMPSPTIGETTSTTRPVGTSSSTVFQAESTPFTRTPSPTTAVEISTTGSTDHPGITRKADPTIENIVGSARKQEDKTKANAAYVISGVFSLLVVIVGLIALVHCHRKRRRNNNQSEDSGRLSVIYSTVDMKQESIGNNNLLNTGDIIIGNKTNLNRDFQGGAPNTYEEIKDTKNPLYNLSTCLSFNIYEELVDVSNGENTGRTQNKNRRRKNNPAYERTEIRNPRRKENPAYESVDGVFKLKRDITSANSL